MTDNFNLNFKVIPQNTNHRYPITVNRNDCHKYRKHVYSIELTLDKVDISSESYPILDVDI